MPVSGAAMSVTEVVSGVGNVLTGALDWMETCLAEITTDNGLIFIPIALGLSLFGIHLLRSFIRN